MKDSTLTLLDTKEVIIAKVAMIKYRIFLLNIKTDVSKDRVSNYQNIRWWILSFFYWEMTRISCPFHPYHFQQS